MIVSIPFHHTMYQADLTKPIIASYPLQSGNENPSAFHVPEPHFEPLSIGDFIGSKALGGSVNCDVLTIIPHGNGTHTECVGHIAKEPYFIADTFEHFHFIGSLITIKPLKTEYGDDIISEQMMRTCIEDTIAPQALMIRTLQYPNDGSKKIWSGNNPPYFTPEAMAYIVAKGIQHILTDLPSVDPEMDNGILAAHRAFWQYPFDTRTASTITEMMYFPEQLVDGLYMVSFHILRLMSDASPSTIVLYKLFQQNLL